MNSHSNENEAIYCSRFAHLSLHPIYCIQFDIVYRQHLIITFTQNVWVQRMSYVANANEGYNKRTSHNGLWSATCKPTHQTVSHCIARIREHAITRTCKKRRRNKAKTKYYAQKLAVNLRLEDNIEYRLLQLTFDDTVNCGLSLDRCKWNSSTSL